jgi:hypothetical protein
VVEGAPAKFAEERSMKPSAEAMPPREKTEGALGEMIFRRYPETRKTIVVVSSYRKSYPR